MPSSGEYAPAPRDGDLERRMTVDKRIDLIRAGLQQWREGFLAYLLQTGTDLADPDMGEHFTDSYAGWYPDRRALMAEQVEVLGWSDGLREFRQERAIPDTGLDFDWDAVWAHCLEVYVVEERLGGVHVFMR